jgi:hypothetical protein
MVARAPTAALLLLAGSVTPAHGQGTLETDAAGLLAFRASGTTWDTALAGWTAGAN